MASNECILDGGHESVHEYPCSLCQKEGKITGATKFCKECFVYMCHTCIQTKHNAFPLNKRHHLLEQSQFFTVKESSLGSFPTKLCPKHPGELVNIYCGEHDIVCCIVCKTLEHSNCAKSQHLFDAAKGVHIQGNECQSIIQETEAFLSDVEKVLNDGKAEMTRIAEAKEQVKAKIEDFRKRVDKYFDDLETKSLDELQTLESKIITEIERDVKNLNAIKTEAEVSLQQLQSFEGDNACELFVHIKDGKRLLRDAKSSHLSTSVHKETIYLEVDPKIEEFLESLDTLGSFTDKPVTITRHPGKAADKEANVVQSVQLEVNSSMALRMCAVNCNILISVSENQNKDKSEIKRYSDSYTYIDSVTIPGRVTSLCEAGGVQAAVLYEREIDLMTKIEKRDFNDPSRVENINTIIAKRIGGSPVRKIGFIAVGRKMILNKIFSTVENAYQMAYIDGKVYVCCGKGPFNPYQDKEQRHSKGTNFYFDYILSNPNGEGCNVCRIAVCDDNGQLQHYIPHSPQLFPFNLEQITVADNAHHFLGYTRSDKTVTVFDLRGNVVDAFGDISGCSEFCTDNKGRVYASGYNGVVRLSTELQKPELILGQKEGIKNQKAICFDKKNSRLLVMSYETTQAKHIFTLHAFQINSGNTWHISVIEIVIDICIKR